MDLRKFIGVEKLTDKEMVYLIEKICSIKILEDCAYIDPLNLELVMRKIKDGKVDDKESIYRNLGPYFSERIEKAKVILIILFNHEKHHWSLAYYVKEIKSIYHYDSVRSMSIIYENGKEEGLNRSFFCSVIKFLIKWEIIEKECNKIEPTFMPRQSSNWECGYHVIITSWLLCLKNGHYRPITKLDIEKNKNLYDFRPGSKSRTQILNLVIDFEEKEKNKKREEEEDNSDSNSESENDSSSEIKEGKQEISDDDENFEKSNKKQKL